MNRVSGQSSLCQPSQSKQFTFVLHLLKGKRAFFFLLLAIQRVTTAEKGGITIYIHIYHPLLHQLGGQH